MFFNNVGYTIEQRVFILQFGWKHNTNSALVIEEFRTKYPDVSLYRLGNIYAEPEY